MLTVNEASLVLGVSARHVYDLVKRGEIAHYRLGKMLRFEETQILEYKEACLVTAKVRKEFVVINAKVSLPGEKSALQKYFEERNLDKPKGKR